MKNYLRITLLGLFLFINALVFFQGCTLRKTQLTYNKLVGTWEVQQYLVDNVDSLNAFKTNSFFVCKFEFVSSKRKTYCSHCANKDDDEILATNYFIPQNSIDFVFPDKKFGLISPSSMDWGCILVFPTEIPTYKDIIITIQSISNTDMTLSATHNNKNYTVVLNKTS